ncbi:MAG: putative toxin, partial [Dermatophilaceae bacterium]
VLDPHQPQQNNGYSYAWNNPITGSDPTGLMRLADGYNGYNGYVGTYRGGGGSASPPSPGGGIKYPLVQPRAPSAGHAPAAHSKSTWDEAKQWGALIGMLFFDAGAITVDAAQFGLDPATDAGTAVALVGTADLASELMGEGAAAAESGIAASARIGRAGEAASGIVKNTQRIPSATGRAAYRIPDELNGSVLGEVKNVKHLNYSSQLQDFGAYAQTKGLQYNLYVRQSTTFSGPLQDLIDSGAINRVPSLGP